MLFKFEGSETKKAGKKTVNLIEFCYRATESLDIGHLFKLNFL